MSTKIDSERGPLGDMLKEDIQIVEERDAAVPFDFERFEEYTIEEVSWPWAHTILETES
jgi:hypothetical protein